MKVEEKIAVDAIKHNKTSHIVLDGKACSECANRICLIACPAELYTIEPDSKEVLVDHTGCLECGTCLIICPTGSIKWQYPEAGYGIRYRFG